MTTESSAPASSAPDTPTTTRMVIGGELVDAVDGQTFEITNPANGTRLPAGTRTLALRGAAWDGDFGVARVDVSNDFGATWTQTRMSPPKNRYDWTRWSAAVELPVDGYYELWVRATDTQGRMQPHTAPGWNPQGYGGNPVSRAAILVG